MSHILQKLNRDQYDGGDDVLVDGALQVWTSIGTYTPAYLTGGTAATSVIATWNAVTDGSFTIEIDGVEIDISGLNFSAAADMDAVAAIIQAAIRAATGSAETVVWSTDHFIISSSDTSKTSAITVASALGSGTDISGEGATTFMDCESGVGTVTARVVATSAVLTNWTFLDFGETVGSLEQETSITYESQDYSAKINTGNDSGAPALLAQIKSGLTAGDLYEVGVAARCGTCEDISLVLLNGDTETATQYFDFATNAWAAFSGQADSKTITESTTGFEANSVVVPVPANGTIYVVAAVAHETGVSQYGYIGKIWLEPSERVNTELSQTQLYCCKEFRDIDLTLPQDPIKIWTCPLGYKALILDMHIETQDVNSITTPGAYNIGWTSANYNDLASGATNFSATQNSCEKIDRTDVVGMIDSGDEIYFKLTTVWDAFEAKATIYLVILLLKIDDFIGDFGGEGGQYEQG